MKSFYITTTLPYVNAEPHIGFALEIVQADVVARYHRMLGYDVVFNFGTDEHGQKIYEKALENKQPPQSYVDEYAKKFDNLKKALNLSYTNFIRTTDSKHKKAAREFWNKSNANGDIYKKLYKVKYCVGCELEKTDSELENGKCPLHPNKELEIREEENYFFRFSKYQDKLIQLYKEHPDFVVPEYRLKEITTFVKTGLNDFSISRLKTKMPWGIPVPGDSDHVMYVWFDALINYISTIGWPDDKEQFTKYWPVVQFAGKDNLRQQSAIWQAMLMSANVSSSRQIVIHGFMSVDGQKMSKSIGNVISPYDLVQKYGAEATRYYLMAKVHPFEDSDFSYEKFEHTYNSDLANGLGNLIARVARLAEKTELEVKACEGQEVMTYESHKPYKEALSLYKFNDAVSYIQSRISKADQYIEKHRPWELEGDTLNEVLNYLVKEIQSIAVLLSPIIPLTAQKIQDQYSGKITSSKPLFPRLQ